MVAHVGNTIVLPFLQEDIPNGDSLYMRAHRTAFDSRGALTFNAFRDRDGAGMSTDWSKYASPTDTRNRGKVPTDNAVLAMHAGAIRDIPGLTVRHTPLLENRAHTDVLGVYGSNKAKARVELLLIAHIVLPLNAP